jgi:putative peptidoglycan lipid II flippase
MSLLRSAATVSGFTLLSRITGLVRDMLIARYFGVSGATDAFYVAFRIPNMLRRLFAEGAFSQAFVPMLSQVKEQEGKERTDAFIGNVFSVLAVAVFLTSLLGVAVAPGIIWLIATGFAEQPETFDLAVALTRFMFPYIIFMSLVAFAAAVLNTWKHFVIPAFTPVLLNVSFIAAILCVTPFLDEPVWALALAVMLGGALQLSLQLVQLKRMGLFPRPVRPSTALKDSAVRQVLKLMLPALVGVSVAPISILINTNIASRLSQGAVTWLSYADRLMEFPTALLGVALGTVLLPSLSGAYAKGDHDRYNALLDGGLRLVVLLAVPAAVGLGLLAEGLTSVLFQGKHFQASDVAQTAVAMRAYAVGLLGLIGIKIIAPAFYARKDIKTPVRVAIASVVVVQLANCISVPLFSHAGLALSVGIGACFNAGVLFVLLVRRGWYRRLPGWGLFALRAVVGAIVMAAFLVWIQTGIEWSQMQNEWQLRLLYVAGVIVAAAVAYFASMFVLGWRGAEIRFALRR